jgi:Flp pilus assembly protein TadG
LALAVRRATRGQALVFFAIVLPAVLLPVAALAAETALVAERQARLSEATEEAATAAALALDTDALRAGSGWSLDPASAIAAASSALSAAEPAAVLDGVAVTGNQVTLYAHETVSLQLAIFVPSRDLAVHTAAVARLTPGYAAPG